MNLELHLSICRKDFQEYGFVQRKRESSKIPGNHNEQTQEIQVKCAQLFCNKV
jgi:hypothetical protein